MYRVFTNKITMGFAAPRTRFYTFIIDESKSDYEKKLLYPIEQYGNTICIGPSCNNCEPPSIDIMNNLEFIGEFESFKDVIKKLLDIKNK